MAIIYDNEIEREYSASADAKHRKALGQFFTPFKVASFMADWILGSQKKELSVLDPAAGFGVFERALNLKSKGKKIFFDLWEIDKKVSSKLSEIAIELGLKTELFEGDFLSGDWNKKYDGIIANPPYYKHHFIKNKEALCQNICLKSHYKFSVQTNIYCWFLIKALNLLADGGRLAYIVPSEFFNSNYGERVKSYLMQSGIILHLININFESCVFDNAMTTSVIILAEKSFKKVDRINFFSVSEVIHLEELETFLKSYPRKSLEIKALDPEIKWRNYFNGRNEQVDVNLVPFSSLGRFSRGIATGANEYFTITPEEKKAYGIPAECLLPCITKACHAKGIVFTDKDFDDLVKKNKKVYLFDGEKAKSEKSMAYIKKGESEEINKRFLTKNRDPWYAIEKREVSKIWVSVFGRKGLKFIWNTSECRNLTCFHAFYPTQRGIKYLDILFIYLNTSYSRNLLDREKREYGNGLEKYEPNDINKSSVINFVNIPQETRIRLADLQRKLIETRNEREKQEIIASADELLLRIIDQGQEDIAINTSLPAIEANVMQKTPTGQLFLIPD